MNRRSLFGGALMAAGIVGAAQAGVLNDPRGDHVGYAYDPFTDHDVLSVEFAEDGGTATISVRIDGFAYVGGAYNYRGGSAYDYELLVGYLQFDTDLDATTGRDAYFGPQFPEVGPDEFGADAIFDFFEAYDGKIPLVESYAYDDRGGGGYGGPVILGFATYTVEFVPEQRGDQELDMVIVLTFDRLLLPAVFDMTGLFGNLPEPTDQVGILRVPAPGAAALLGMGLLAGVRRRR